jgi:hypothetical protein
VVPSEVDFIGDIASNIVVEQDNLYFASRDSIYMLDALTGNKIWASALPEKLVSKSSIFIHNNLLCMINLGYATRNQNAVNFGAPFFAAFNISNGKQEFLQSIEPKNSLILDYRLQENGQTIILQEDKLSVLSNVSGEVQSSVSYDVYKYGSLNSFVDDDYFVLGKDSISVNLANSEEGKIWISTTKNLIIGLNKNYEVESFYAQKDIYTRVFQYNDILFLRNQKETVVVDNNYRKIAGISLSKNAFIKGSRLFDFNGNGLLVVDLETVFQQ